EPSQYGRWWIPEVVGVGDVGEPSTLRGAGPGSATATTAEDERDADGDDGAGERPRDVHPVGGEVRGDEVGAERARRVHRRTRDWAAPQAGERDIAADTQPPDDAE